VHYATWRGRCQHFFKKFSNQVRQPLQPGGASLVCPTGPGRKVIKWLRQALGSSIKESGRRDTQQGEENKNER